jgi:hypothetical protein
MRDSDKTWSLAYVSRIAQRAWSEPLRMPRLSIAKVMAGIVVVAINIAIGRAMYGSNTMLLFLVAPMGFACQLALLCWAAGPRGPRSFWAGFAASSLLMMPLSVWIFTSGAYRQEIGALWMMIASAIVPSAVRDNDRHVLGPLFMIAWTLPQLILAMVGGGLLRRLAGPVSKPARAGSIRPEALSSLEHQHPDPPGGQIA